MIVKLVNLGQFSILICVKLLNSNDVNDTSFDIVISFFTASDSLAPIFNDVIFELLISIFSDHPGIIEQLVIFAPDNITDDKLVQSVKDTVSELTPVKLTVLTPSPATVNLIFVYLISIVSKHG